jgi:hypothetical protein
MCLDSIEEVIKGHPNESPAQSDDLGVNDCFEDTFVDLN